MPTACAACTASAICVMIAATSSAGQRRVLLGVSLEELARRPLDGEEVHARTGLADLDGAHDVRMLHALAVARLADETRDRGPVLAQLLAQHLHRDDAVRRDALREIRRRCRPHRLRCARVYPASVWPTRFSFGTGRT